jgi:hypothetical protein
MIKLTSVVAMLVAAGAVMGQPSGTGFLKTKVDPGRAGVFVDGKYVGPACNFGVGRKYAVPTGEHKIKLVEPRYEDMETTVNVHAGKTTEVKQTMKALPAPKGPFGTIRTIAPPDKFAAVYVNDHFMGHAGEFNNSTQGLVLPVGEYDVRVEPMTGSPVKQHVKVEAEKTVIVK